MPQLARMPFRRSRFPGRPDLGRVVSSLSSRVRRCETRPSRRLSEGYALSGRLFVDTMTPVPGDPPRIPFTYWAQRKDRLFLTLECPNAEDPKVHLTDDGVLTFSANAKSDSTEADHHYELKLELLHPINAKDSQIHVGPRRVTMVIAKTEENAGPHWPRLLRSAEKNPHVKTDFDKWVDEDEEDEADRADAFDMSSLESMSKYREDDFVDPADSDDDEDMPPLERAK